MEPAMRPPRSKITMRDILQRQRELQCTPQFVESPITPISSFVTSPVSIQNNFIQKLAKCKVFTSDFEINQELDIRELDHEMRLKMLSSSDVEAAENHERIEWNKANSWKEYKNARIPKRSFDLPARLKKQ